MPKDNEKGMGKMIALVSAGCVLAATLGSVVAIAYAGGGRIATVESDIGFAKTAIVKTTEDIKERTEKVDSEIKDIRKELSEAELRDQRMATQYSKIEGYMEQSVLQNIEIKTVIKEIKEQQIQDGKTLLTNKVTLETLTKDD